MFQPPVPLSGHILMVVNRLLNTVKYIKMACSSNFGNVFSVLGTLCNFPEDLAAMFWTLSCFGLATLPTNVAPPAIGSEPPLRLFSRIDSLVGVLHSFLWMESLFMTGTMLIPNISNIRGHGVPGPLFASWSA